MQIPHPQPLLIQIRRQILAQPLGQRRHQHPLPALHTLPAPLHQIRHLPLRRSHLDHRIQETRRPNHLLRHHAPAPGQLVLPGRRRHEHQPRHNALKLLEPQRPIVQRRRQSKPVLHQHRLPRPIPIEHRVDLRQRHVRLINDAQPVPKVRPLRRRHRVRRRHCRPKRPGPLRSNPRHPALHGLVSRRRIVEIVQQRVRPLPHAPPVEEPRVVLDPVAIPHLVDHLKVILRPRKQPLRLQQLALRPKLHHPSVQLPPDLLRDVLQRVRTRHIVHRREQEELPLLRQQLRARRIDELDPRHIVPEQLDPHRELLVRRPDLDHVPAHTILRPRKLDVRPLILHRVERKQELPPIDHPPASDRQHPLPVRLRRPKSEDARHARHHDRVPTGQNVARRRKTQLIQLVVPRRVLLDVDVPLRDVRLRLVVVVVRHEVVHAVVRKQLAHLLVELRRQRLVVADDDRRPLKPRDRVRHRERLPRPRRPKQRHALTPRLQLRRKLLDRLRLIPRGLERTHDLKRALLAEHPQSYGLSSAHPRTVASSSRGSRRPSDSAAGNAAPSVIPASTTHPTPVGTTGGHPARSIPMSTSFTR